ncbi:hypothetical protein AAFN47_09615 [Hoeflea sp. CAU 1731]
MKYTTLVLAAAIAVMPVAGNAGEPLAAFDVAEDMSRFVFSAAPVFDDGMPAYGNAFITQGYLYPTGTLDGGVKGTLPNAIRRFRTSSSANGPVTGTSWATACVPKRAPS